MGGGALPERLVAAQRAPHAGVAQQSDDGGALREAVQPVVGTMPLNVGQDALESVLVVAPLVEGPVRQHMKHVALRARVVRRGQQVGDAARRDF